MKPIVVGERLVMTAAPFVTALLVGLGGEVPVVWVPVLIVYAMLIGFDVGRSAR